MSSAGAPGEVAVQPEDPHGVLTRAESTQNKNEPSTVSEPLALTVAEAARLLRLDPRTVRRLLQNGALAGNRSGHVLRLSRASVLAWIAHRERNVGWSGS